MKEMQTVNDVLEELERNRFYGSIELKLEAGKVVLLRKTETIKPSPETYRDNRGLEDVHHNQ
jgi:hypothetical protein